MAVLRHHTAGDPMDERVRWTDLSLGEIVTASRRLCASFLMISCPYGTIVPFLSLNQMGKLFNHDSLVEPISAQETRVFEKRQARREVR